MWANIPPEIREQIVATIGVILTALGLAVTLVIRFYAQKLMFQKAAENMVEAIDTHGSKKLEDAVKVANIADGIEGHMNVFVNQVKEKL